MGYKPNFSIYDENDWSRERPRKFEKTGDELYDAVFEGYQDALKECNAVDFDDLRCLTVSVFSQHEEARLKWARRYDFIMVDEFQDTNLLQLDIVRLLGHEHQNVCVVGDDDQSIYSWRGAEITNILEFDQHFARPKIVKLEQNYRGTDAILGVANSLIQENPHRQVKSLWGQNGEGDKVRVMEIPDSAKEAQYVVDEIENEHLRERAPWSDFAVIFRMNDLSRSFEENLRRAKIPYRIVGGQSFFDL